MKIMMIEKNKCLVEILQSVFNKNGCQVIFVSSNQINIENFIYEYLPDLIIIDLGCFEGIEKIKNILKKFPVLYLTSDVNLIEENDNVFVLSKPFSPQILIKHIKNIFKIKRTNKNKVNKPENIQLRIIRESKTEFDVITRHFKLNFGTHEVYLDNRLINLTPKEYKILKLLIQNPRQVFTREQLLEVVWTFEFLGDTRNVDTHIKSLRKKFTKYGNNIIKTIWGVGYMFDDSQI